MNELEFLDWKEAISRLERLQGKLKEELDKKNGYDFLPAWALWVALWGQIQTLKNVNTKYLNCRVPWDTALGLPSLPTLEADAKKCRDYLENGDALGAVLGSFCEWTLLFQETIPCACGAFGLRLRNVDYDFLINHSLLGNGKTILIKQFLCIKSEDKKHLANHYARHVAGNGGRATQKFQNPSKVLANTIIPWTAINGISIEGERVLIEKKSLDFAKEFYDPYEKPSEFVFGKRFMEIVKKPRA